VVCITASGDRPLNLLMQDCAEVVTVDLNLVQNYLLQLKSAALKEFSYDEYLLLLFAEKGFVTQESIARVLRWLEPGCRAYWLSEQEKLFKGVLYQGRTEVLLKRINRFSKWFINKERISKLFEIDSLEEQREFINKHWDTKKWQKLAEWALHPTISKWLLFKDPGLYNHLSQEIGKPGNYIYNRLHNYLMHGGVAKKSLMLSLAFNGKVHKEAYPPYLQQEESQIIKDRLDRLTITTDNMISFLESKEENSFDCFSFSDIASYITGEDFKRLMEAMYRTARPGARFSIRQFLSHQIIPEPLSPHFVRDPELEKKLSAEDHCFVYRFMVGTIEK
jgi:S-adenosylmethionine-diacylglycerol 3-amino-3-carboxypropyl transferase